MAFTTYHTNYYLFPLLRFSYNRVISTPEFGDFNARILAKIEFSDKN